MTLVSLDENTSKENNNNAMQYGKSPAALETVTHTSQSYKQTRAHTHKKKKSEKHVKMNKTTQKAKHWELVISVQCMQEDHHHYSQRRQAESKQQQQKQKQH